MIIAHPKECAPVAKSPETTKLEDDDSVFWVVERIVKNSPTVLTQISVLLFKTWGKGEHCIRESGDHCSNQSQGKTLQC